MCETGIDWDKLCKEDCANFDINDGEEDNFLKQTLVKNVFSQEAHHVFTMVLKYLHS